MKYLNSLYATAQINKVEVNRNSSNLNSKFQRSYAYLNKFTFVKWMTWAKYYSRIQVQSVLEYIYYDDPLI